MVAGRYRPPCQTSPERLPFSSLPPCPQPLRVPGAVQRLQARRPQGRRERRTAAERRGQRSPDLVSCSPRVANPPRCSPSQRRVYAAGHAPRCLADPEIFPLPATPQGMTKQFCPHHRGAGLLLGAGGPAAHSVGLGRRIPRRKPSALPTDSVVRRRPAHDLHTPPSHTHARTHVSLSLS